MVLFSFLLVALSAHADPLNADQHRRAEAMTNYFENSTIYPQYGYIENLHDGRGYTAGRAGFTTGTGDLYDLVKNYCVENRDSNLCGYLPTLERLAKSSSGSTKELGKNFVKDWTAEANLSSFQLAQDLENETMYFEPSQKIADRLHLQTALGRAICFDTIIQHGDGRDPDGIHAIIERTEKSFGVVNGNEPDWLMAFLEMRRQDLLHPSDPTTQEVWAESVDRVDFLESQLKKQNFNLDGPIEMSPDQPSADTLIP